MTYYDNIGVGLNGCILMYFYHINILRFIIYSIVLYNYSYIHSEVFSYDNDVFFSQSFPPKYDVFLHFNILLLCNL